MGAWRGREWLLDKLKQAQRATNTHERFYRNICISGFIGTTAKITTRLLYLIVNSTLDGVATIPNDRKKKQKKNEEDWREGIYF